MAPPITALTIPCPENANIPFATVDTNPIPWMMTAGMIFPGLRCV